MRTLLKTFRIKTTSSSPVEGWVCVRRSFSKDKILELRLEERI